MISILAILQVAQAYNGPHNVMSPLPSRMLVDDRYATMACQQRLVLTMSVYVCEWCALLHYVVLARTSPNFFSPVVLSNYKKCIVKRAFIAAPHAHLSS